MIQPEESRYPIEIHNNNDDDNNNINNFIYIYIYIYISGRQSLFFSRNHRTLTDLEYERF